ncbi:MAG: formylglycine-generating enzyme family protein [Flavobacteriales bacterium]|nr:formylglycine-generating enzyme family protein [Flavobacteriales bacterium]
MKPVFNVNWRASILIKSAGAIVSLWLITLIAFPKNDALTTITQCMPPSTNPEMVFIPGGGFIMGSAHERSEEKPPIEVKVGDFWISKTEITNGQFQTFVAATGYTTLAERVPDPSNETIPPDQRIPGSVVFIPPVNQVVDSHMLSWWRFIAGANWRHPEGPNSDITSRKSHPVVHIAYEDALAYARWQGCDLPTEEQFEYVARGGLENKRFAWGDKFVPEGKHMANTWQGLFPFKNNGKDGHLTSAPVACFPTNQYGLYDLIGNVWEWTTRPYYPSHRTIAAASSYGYDPHQPGLPVKVIKGGSFLCAPNYCARYRPAARQAQDVGLGASHIGFRIISNKTPTTGK